MNIEQLNKIMPHAKKRAILMLPHINKAMEEFQIDTDKRVAAFIAQVAHESGELRYMEEIASGEAYERRLDLGNTQPGDGKRYKGRGLIQLTGRNNYHLFSQHFGVDFINDPELVAEPEWAARSAGFFWKMKSLNVYADKDDFRTLTRKINGGFTGYADRIVYWDRAKKVLGVQV